jgi:hypothetical protein
MCDKVTVTMLAEKWSGQNAVEITREEWETLQKMDMMDKWYWMIDKFPYLDSWDIVEVGIREIKK